MPLGNLGAPECSRSGCYKKIYSRDDDGSPLCVTHYREKYDEQALQSDYKQSEGADRNG